jgi:chromosome segregation ATPase
MDDEVATLADKIKKLEEKIEKLEQHIVKDDFASTPYDDRVEAKAALKDLSAKETQLNDQLKTLYDTRKIALTQQQQQSGAGTSNGACAPRSRNIPVCCIHLQTL